ncbi:site-specific DNA-methyltransferase [Facklamia sp. 7083-14-GEN3]|uniref:site-specific DNA-methyltransferase n=1 Tax=Facklamia sp. 7083-14-GEN3 TaxID=2973478 RepID=UPI00215BA657|nr:site-specific DNA-methyltransferase [Facklamia sp. 7083-14-GEN3]MCR8969083.1 site-specific DNA-methyltransferase [Facklamia sp. 7083-14-GEN3]
MSKLTGETLNIEEENIQKIKELFPEVETDGKIDFDKLKQLLGDYVEDSGERYNFTWNGKGEALRISQTPSMGTLRPLPEESKNWDKSENLYIEGDNLEVLKLLQKSYFNKIKMIYIDPPYNTGGDFVYKDNFKDNIKNYKEITGQLDSDGKLATTNREYSGRYHTDWLNMIYPRLRLARNLLTEDGVIFISIDDNEVHNLLKISDEIFGENNFITELKWRANPRGRTTTKFIGKTFESVLMYAKDIHKFEIQDAIINDDKKMKQYKYEDVKGRYKKGYPLHNGTKDFHINNRPNLCYSIYYNPDKQHAYVVDEKKYNSQTHSWELERYTHITEDGYHRIIPKYNEEYQRQRVWRWGQEKFLAEYKDDLIFEQEKNGFYIYGKDRLKDGKIFEKNKDIIDGIYTDNGTREMIAMKLEKTFDFPKPTELIKKFLLMIPHDSEEEMNVLDFFAGSSTTAHAVMDLNAEDNGNRKFIMVQLPEAINQKSEAFKAGYENIAEIGKERIRRAGERIKDGLIEKYESSNEEERKKMKHPEDLDIGFKTFKLDSSNIKQWNPGQYENIQLAIEDSLTPYVEGRSEQDVVYEMILKMGLDLTYPVEEYEVNGKTIYSVGYGFLMISLADEIDLNIAEKMIEIRNKYQPEEFRVIFRDEGFKNDMAKTNIKETLRSAGIAEEAFITL